MKVHESVGSSFWRFRFVGCIRRTWHSYTWKLRGEKQKLGPRAHSILESVPSLKSRAEKRIGSCTENLPDTPKGQRNLDNHFMLTVGILSFSGWKKVHHLELNCHILSVDLSPDQLRDDKLMLYPGIIAILRSLDSPVRRDPLIDKGWWRFPCRSALIANKMHDSILIEQARSADFIDIKRIDALQKGTLLGHYPMAWGIPPSASGEASNQAKCILELRS